MSKTFAATVIFSVIAFAVAVPAARQNVAVSAAVDELWQEPTDIATRDLVAGPGGTALAPAADATYQFVAHKTSGTNPGYDVRDSAGRLWSVKLGEEAQSEVAASRILWAIGFHQPPTYYLPQWTLAGEDAGVKPAGRFRTDPDHQRAADEWSWYDNPFTNTAVFRGLVVAQMILNNWDLKTSNNRVYEASDGAGPPQRRYVVRDLGASLGKARQLGFFKWLGIRDKQGSKNNLEDFESQGFITGVDGNRVEFDYSGLDKRLFQRVSQADVVWTCELLSRLSDAQWDDLFRAAGYSPDHRRRYIAKIKQKIDQGLALRERMTR